MGQGSQTISPGEKAVDSGGFGLSHIGKVGDGVSRRYEFPWIRPPEGCERASVALLRRIGMPTR